MLHAAFVRSPHAHARIRGIDASAAAALPGVAAVYAVDDLRPFLADAVMPLEQPSGALRQSVSPSLLADGEVRYVGEPVACVVAESRYLAEDAAAAVAADYEELPVSADWRRALEDGAPPAHAGSAHNLVAAFHARLRRRRRGVCGGRARLPRGAEAAQGPRPRHGMPRRGRVHGPPATAC